MRTLWDECYYQPNFIDEKTEVQVIELLNFLAKITPVDSKTQTLNHYFTYAPSLWGNGLPFPWGSAHWSCVLLCYCNNHLPCISFRALILIWNYILIYVLICLLSPHWTVILPNIGSIFFFFANLHAAAHMHSNTQKISQKRWKNKCRCKWKKGQRNFKFPKNKDCDYTSHFLQHLPQGLIQWELNKCWRNEYDWLYINRFVFLNLSH